MGHKANHAAHGEVKTTAGFSLTPTSIQAVKNLAKNEQISQSEVVERLIRENLVLSQSGKPSLNSLGKSLEVFLTNLRMISESGKIDYKRPKTV